MEQNIRLGRIAGIPVGINWSILVIFWLIAWELADLVLPGYNPHETTTIYWAVGILTTVLFFVALLLHEVSHAIVAKHNAGSESAVLPFGCSAGYRSSRARL